jgi:hypothetical protein
MKDTAALHANVRKLRLQSMQAFFIKLVPQISYFSLAGTKKALFSHSE